MQIRKGGAGQLAAKRKQTIEKIVKLGAIVGVVVLSVVGGRWLLRR